MEVVIVTGLSGAGKTQAIKIFEDIGYFCVDNLLPELLEQFIQTYMSKRNTLKNIAVGIDARTAESFDSVLEILSKKDKDITYKILFLDAENEVLVKRYKENRRKHPLAQGNRIIDGIIEERKRLELLKSNADYVIDTSNLLIRKLKEELLNLFLEKDSKNGLLINILSFGFKYGVPDDVDLVFDVRFLPNPFYIDELKRKTGNDKEVQDFVLKFEEANIFINKLNDMLKFLIPYYTKEGKSQLVIGIGCTGGQHRSVTIANKIYDIIKKDNTNTVLQHRECERYKNK